MFQTRRYLWILGFSFLFLLDGCGYNGARSASSSSTPSQPSPSSSANTVVLQMGATQYQPGETIRVTIRNQSKQTISFSDHLTNCTVLLLEHQEGSFWKPVAPCKLMTPTRLLFLKAGTSLDITLISSSQWSDGVYRAKLDYSAVADVPNVSVDSGPAKTVYSNEFRVNVGN